MRLHQLHRTTWLPIPVEKAFDFFCDPLNLQRITPPELDFSLRDGRPGEIGEGAEIVYRMRLWGVPITWQSRIEDWSPNQSFTDIALKSPYRLWHHRHYVVADRDGTTMIDLVNYALPLWPFGELAHPIVRRQLGRIFDYREATIQQLLGTGIERAASAAHQAA
ncbi:SRPBCC family protein [Myxococcota bacterium]|nr:SRPBCC family protein [Myxococcota bacterium]